MSNKMLIDASHPEETRVAVVRGNRIEEFDFESQEKKQLRGNIYLAKVTRVEPSLQAAFIDYGGNRHGFLAFSEIHPDYYQIPVADRQALLEAEAAEARAAREADDADEDDAVAEVAEDEEAAPKKKPRRRRGRKSKAAEGETADAVAETSDEDGSSTDTDETNNETASDKSTEEAAGDAPVDAAADALEETSEAEEKPKPKRRSTRRKKAPIKAKEEETETDADAEPSGDAEDDSGDDKDPSGTMAAMVEMDSISEPLPDDEASDDDSNQADEELVAEEKPKTRRTSRPRRKTKAEKEAEETAEVEAETPAPKEDAVAAETASEEVTETASEEAEQSEAEAETESEKPKKKPRRRSPRKKAQAEEAKETDDDAEASEDDAVESVGQEDAMEEMPAPRRLRRHYKIQEVIKRRQVLLVQVVKEERGNKGAALTTYLSLAGRYSVLMPNTARGGGISRKITNSSDRKRLKGIASELDVPAGMGVILRTAGAARTNEEITRDFEYLMRLWEQVRNLTLSSSAPCLVYEEGSLIKRSIRDLYNKDTGEVIVAGEDGFNEAKDFMNMLMPTHTKKVKQYKGSQAIFAKYGVEGHLDKMVSPQVTLKSGGYLVINQTEALVAVDVNSGRSTREHSVEDTALQTNLEAAEEVARQLRLRDLAGLIVIDFIDMEERRNNRSVEKKLKDCLKSDRARIQVGRISHFGLMEMSRQRMRASVLESTMDTCPHCAGTGYVRSDSAIALHVFRAIEEHVSRHNKFDCIIKTSPAIAIHILNHKRSALTELETRYGLQILIEADGEIAGQEFKIEKGEPARGDSAPAPVGFQNEAAFEAVENSEDDDSEENGRRKRSRRRRKKGSEEASDQSTEATEEGASSSDENTGADGGESSEDDDDKPRKKRRRGKRGGRKARDTDSESEENPEASDSDGSAPNENTAEKVTSEETDAEVESPSEEEKPKSRSTRRKKAPIAPKPEVKKETFSASAEVSETQEAEKAEEPPKPKRRTTRRAPVKKTEEAATAEAGGEATSNEAPSDAEASETDGSEGTSDGKKKGWWKRGGGFF